MKVEPDSALTGRASVVPTVIRAGDLHVTIPHTARAGLADSKERKRQRGSWFRVLYRFVQPSSGMERKLNEPRMQRRPRQAKRCLLPRNASPRRQLSAASVL